MGAKACLILSILLLSYILIPADVTAREMLQEPQTGVGLKSDVFVDGEREGTIGGGSLEKKMSSIPADMPWRGCASSFRAPVSEEDEQAAVVYGQLLDDFNANTIVYRPGYREYDILHHVFRWDNNPFEEVFQTGFQARRQNNTPNEIFFNLDHYVHNAGRPLDSTRPATHVFVSATLDSGWYPSLDRQRPRMEVYRYEIYAPGGIWVVPTLGDRFQYRSQDEVAFVAGIAPQYILSAQRFRLTFDNTTGQTRRTRIDTILTRNSNFNPLAAGNIQMPVYYYLENRRRVPLNIRCYPSSQRKKREPFTDCDATNASNNQSYIDAAFRSSVTNEAYLFMNNEHVLINYAPGTTHDRVLDGPLLTGDWYPSLGGTAFAEYGIDCAFGSENQTTAFIFSGNLCAYIDYAPHTTNDKIIKGPMTITEMFPFLKGTAFESGVDAAFESTKTYEAYLFKGDQYARINYIYDDSHLLAIRLITEGFPSLKGTIFESGFDAAFASHKHNEAYIFKGDSYALIYFAPGTTDGYIINSVKKILPHKWPSLRGIVPIENHDIDAHDHTVMPEAPNIVLAYVFKLEFD